MIDTRELPWEPHVGIAGGWMKVLKRDDAGEPQVLIGWIPNDRRPTNPERHYHRTVHEQTFVLAGELPMREFESVDDEQGLPVLFRKGYFMDRRRGSVHGADARRPSPTGFVGLDWRSGRGTYLTEPTAAEETFLMTVDPEDAREGSLVPPDARPGTVVDRGGLLLLDTRALGWEERPGAPGAKWKPLVRNEAGDCDAAIVWLPPGRPVAGAGDLFEYFYVLDGESGSLRKGSFVDGSWDDAAGESATGVSFLGWRPRAGA